VKSLRTDQRQAFTLREDNADLPMLNHPGRLPMKQLLLFLLLVGISLAVAGCGSSSGGNTIIVITATPTVAPTVTPTPEPTATPTPTPDCDSPANVDSAQWIRVSGCDRYQ
jgi:hypothetical protein